MSGRRKFVAAVALALVGLGAVASSASATFHLMKIREVSSGTGTADSSYVEIQMYFDFQSFLSNGAKLVRCDATCSSPTTFAPFTNVANGRSQDTVLFADSGIGSGSKDFNVNLNLDSIQAGGAVCYLSEPGFADCVSWGNFSADRLPDGELRDHRRYSRRRAGLRHGPAPLDRFGLLDACWSPATIRTTARWTSR